jgi:hypothetical protein
MMRSGDANDDVISNNTLSIALTHNQREVQKALNANAQSDLMNLMPKLNSDYKKRLALDSLSGSFLAQTIIAASAGLGMTVFENIQKPRASITNEIQNRQDDDDSNQQTLQEPWVQGNFGQKTISNNENWIGDFKQTEFGAAAGLPLIERENDMYGIFVKTGYRQMKQELNKGHAITIEGGAYGYI